MLLADYKFSRNDILNLFLVCLVPIHLWSIYLLLNDISWVMEQFSLDLLIGYAGYALIAALLESVVATAFLLVLSIFLPRKWPATRKLALLAVITFLLSLWAAANQIFFLMLESPPAFLSWILLRIPYHQQLAYGLLVAIIILSIVVPVYFFIRSDKFQENMLQLIEKLTILAVFYLGLDLIGAIIILIRLVKV